MASITRIKQRKQARNSEAYDDQKPAGPVMESDPDDLEADLNNIRSQIHRILDRTLNSNWYDAPQADLKDIAAIVELLESSGGDLSVIIALADRRYGVTLIGAVNGVNTVFLTPLKFRHDGVRNEVFYVNGVRQEHGAGNDYTASETLVGAGYDTITMAYAPVPGDKLTIDFTPVAA